MSKVIFVLGMHRSGTSVSTGILQALGVRLSDDLIPAADENSSGYFESAVITDIQEQLLNAMGGSMWWTSTTLTPLPANWWRLPAVQPYKQRLIEHVKAETSGKTGPWAFKDPRTARLLPLWNEIIDELGLDAQFVLVVRHPAEVAQSLYKRQKMSPAYAELLWLEHNADAALYGGNRLKAVVEYRHWFENPVEQAAYLIKSLNLEMPDDARLNEIVDRLVAKDLRHHQAPGSAAYELPFSKDVYQALVARDVGQLELLSQVFNISRNFLERILTLHNQGKLQGAVS